MSETNLEESSAATLSALLCPIEIAGWKEEFGQLCTDDGYGIVLTLPQGGYMTMPREMSRRILSVLTGHNV